LSQDPLRPATLVAATDQGIFRSTDAGATWTQQSKVAGLALSRSPVDSSMLYGVAGMQQVYRSTDGGMTWIHLTPQVGGPIAPDTLDSDTAYYTYTLEGYFGLYKTTDAGTSWTNLVSATGQKISLTFVAADGTLFGSAPDGNFKSTDRGATWSRLAPPADSGRLLGAALPVLYVVGPRAILKTLDDGATWFQSGVLPVGGGFQLWPSPVDSALLFGIVSGSPGIFVSHNSGGSWSSSTAGLEFAPAIQSIAPGTGSAAAAYAIAPNVGAVTFVSELDSTGAELLFSTLLGGADRDAGGNSIALQGPGEVVVGGISHGFGFPVTTNSPIDAPESAHGFVTRMIGLPLDGRRSVPRFRGTTRQP
jgi:photosystem II stability/assembly factor-like uncharacterized protein